MLNLKRQFAGILILAIALTAAPPVQNPTVAVARTYNQRAKKQSAKKNYGRKQQRKAHHRQATRRHQRRHHHHRVHVTVWHAPHYWHPIGFTVAVLATTAIVVSVASSGGDSGGKDGGGQKGEYYYDQGTWMQKSGNVYEVIPAPVGAEISNLPPGAEPTQASNKTYYYYGGDFYKRSDGKYVVVAAPFGAEVSSLPEGFEERNVGKGGEEDYYYVYNGVWYESVSDGDEVLFVVTPAP